MMKQKKTAALAVLSTLCAAIWLYRIFFRGENDSLTVIAGIAWTVCAVTCSLRAAREWKGKLDR